MIVGMTFDKTLTLGSVTASRGQYRAALIVAAAAVITTLGLLPYARLPGPVVPAFLPANQTALLIAYMLGAGVLYAQFRRGRSLSLLLAATASLFTAGIMALQFASFPGMFAPAPARLLGSGPDTTTWLWTFWHAGPAALGLAYAATVRRERAARFTPDRTARVIVVSMCAALLLTAAAGGFSTMLLPWLPRQTDGDNYIRFVNTGVGPTLVLSTVVALTAMWRATRRGRTVLELWIVASLVLLTLDSILTQAGLTRGSVGWMAGRMGALISALAVLWAYLHEVNATHARSEGLAAAALLRSDDALRQSQKMDAVGHLTSGIAHDFNNLLMIVNGAFEIIQKHASDGKTEAMVQLGLKAVQRGASLTNQLLAFSGRKVLRPETISPNAVLVDFQAMALRAVSQNVCLVWNLDPAPHLVVLDTVEFETALLNIVVNARDALRPHGGRIVFSTRNAVLAPGAMPLGARPADMALPAGAYVVTSVTDDGPGMPEDVALSAFDPFFTTKEVGRGTGLGLSQVYGFARSAGGLAVIVSTVGGTTIEIWLPRDGTSRNEDPVWPVAQAGATRASATGKVLQDRVILQAHGGERLGFTHGSTEPAL